MYNKELIKYILFKLGFCVKERFIVNVMRKLGRKYDVFFFKIFENCKDLNVFKIGLLFFNSR